jgi:ATP-dependent protease ClpP protease subunit
MIKTLILTWTLVSFLVFTPAVPRGNVGKLVLESEVTAGSVAPLITSINNLSSGDTVYLYLASPGGEADAGFQLVSAMQHTHGKVIVVVEGDIASMAIDIALAGNQIIVLDTVHNNNNAVIHAAYVGTRNYAFKIHSADGLAAIHARQRVDYKDILTTEEMHQVMDNYNDMYIHVGELIYRFNHHQLPTDSDVSYGLSSDQKIGYSIAALGAVLVARKFVMHLNNLN